MAGFFLVKTVRGNTRVTSRAQTEPRSATVRGSLDKVSGPLEKRGRELSLVFDLINRRDDPWSRRYGYSSDADFTAKELKEKLAERKNYWILIASGETLKKQWTSQSSVSETTSVEVHSQDLEEFPLVAGRLKLNPNTRRLMID